MLFCAYLITFHFLEVLKVESWCKKFFQAEKLKPRVDADLKPPPKPTSDHFSRTKEAIKNSCGPLIHFPIGRVLVLHKRYWSYGERYIWQKEFNTILITFSSSVWVWFVILKIAYCSHWTFKRCELLREVHSLLLEYKLKQVLEGCVRVYPKVLNQGLHLLVPPFLCSPLPAPSSPLTKIRQNGVSPFTRP